MRRKEWINKMMMKYIWLIVYSRNSLLPLKQLSSAPTQAKVALQIPALLSASLAQAGHSFPFSEVLGAGHIQEKEVFTCLTIKIKDQIAIGYSSSGSYWPGSESCSCQKHSKSDCGPIV